MEIISVLAHFNLGFQFLVVRLDVFLIVCTAHARKLFQFLVVRLDDPEKPCYQLYLPISIPCGAIRC